MASSREVRIDILRGYAMLAVAIAHLGNLLRHLKLIDWDFPTLGNHSYASAAELFVFLAGYMVGLVYLRRERARYAIIKRIRHLYAVSLYAFLACFLIVFLFPYELADASGFGYFLSHPIRGTLDFLMLVRQPIFLDVLQLYVLLLLVAAVCCRQMIKRPDSVLGFSFGVYVSIQLSHLFGFQINLPGGMPDNDLQWGFNPFAWQFLFLLGMWAAQRRLLSRGFTVLEKHRWICILSICLFAVTIAVHVLDEHVSANIPFVWKVNLQPVRLLNFIVMLTADISALVLMSRWLGTPVFSFLRLIGRNTLYCYALSVPATYLLDLLIVWIGISWASCLSATVTLTLSMYVMALIRERLFRGRLRPQFARS